MQKAYSEGPDGALAAIRTARDALKRGDFDVVEDALVVVEQHINNRNKFESGDLNIAPGADGFGPGDRN